MTAQDNTANINECVSLSSQGSAWIGLRRDSPDNWDWTSDDAPTYIESEVNWRQSFPRSSSQSSDCAVIITAGQRQTQIANPGGAQCDSTRQYCCNPVSSGNTLDPTPVPTSVPTSVTASPVSSPSSVSTPPPNCPRIRKEWNTATQAERDLYINGMLELANAGRLSIFTQQHGHLVAEDQAHGTSGFLPWHRYETI